MKKFKLLSLLLIISLFAGALSVPAMALDDPVTNAPMVSLMDTNTGDILFEKEAGATFTPGTLNTLMTALVVGDSLDRQDVRMDDVVTASENAYYNVPDGDEYIINLTPGENLTVEQLLYATALFSAHDAANTLGEYISGSCDAFVDAMNSKAEELGCENTHFTDTNGLDLENQYTTAHDLSLIARAVFRSQQVSEMFKTPYYTIPATAFSGERALSNANAFLKSDASQYYGLCYAGKASSSAVVGWNLVSAASYNGMDVIAVVTGCPDGVDRYAEAKSLFEWVFANYSYRTLVSSTDVLDTVHVAMGSPDTVSVCAGDSIQILLPNDKELSDLTLDITYEHEKNGTELQAPLSVGEYLGELTVSMDGKVQGSSRAVVATAVDISRLDYLRSQLEVLLENPSVLNAIKILLVALGVYLLLVVVYFIQRLVHLHSLRRARKARAASRSKQELGWLELPGGGEGGYLPEGGPDAPPMEEPLSEDDGQPVEEEAEAPEGETEFVQEEAEPAEDETEVSEAQAEPVEAEEEPAEEGADAAEEEEAAFDEDEAEPAGDEAESVQEEEGPAGDGDEPVGDEAEASEEAGPVEDEGAFAEEGAEPAEDEIEFIEDEDAEDEAEAPEDEIEFIEDDGSYYEEEDAGEFIEDDGGDYEDEDDSGEPPETPKRHWWKRK